MVKAQSSALACNFSYWHTPLFLISDIEESRTGTSEWGSCRFLLAVPIFYIYMITTLGLVMPLHSDLTVLLVQADVTRAIGRKNRLQSQAHFGYERRIY